MGKQELIFESNQPSLPIYSLPGNCRASSPFQHFQMSVIPLHEWVCEYFYLVLSCSNCLTVQHQWKLSSLHFPRNNMMVLVSGGDSHIWTMECIQVKFGHTRGKANFYFFQIINRTLAVNMTNSNTVTVMLTRRHWNISHLHIHVFSLLSCQIIT